MIALKKILLLGLACVLISSAVFSQSHPKREFRAAWIATVANIDWPSKPGLPAWQQRQEFTQLLDLLQQNGMNAVIVQIRPCADAFYPSTLEPWSYWLTGVQGQAPDPYYDPLQFMITETHKRGMEFHAWFNPYRAVFNIYTSKVAANHITRVRPDWFLTYGDKKYFNPGIPEVWTYLTNLIRDVVRRYDIDGVHFDDYFYPYRIPGKEFPDYAAYRKYGKGMNIDDWRRHNVDTVIEMVSEAIKQEKPWVKFGVSPFGVWRNISKDPDGSDTRAGQTDYDDLYADVLLWLRKGWIDYVTPQLYWEFGNRAAPYGELLDWWSRHTYGRALYIGQALYRVGSSAAWRNPGELPAELEANRRRPEVGGSVYFSAICFNKYNLGFGEALKNRFYKYPALIPTMPWIDSMPPSAPVITVAQSAADGVHLSWNDTDTSRKTTAFVIYRFQGNTAGNTNDPANILAIVNRVGVQNTYLDTKSRQGYPCTYLITALDRLHNESGLSNAVRVQ